MKICLLGSGSKGNSIYIENRSTAIIIDQGFSYIELKRRLESRGLDESKINGILVTHEHDDHIRGAGVTARKLGIPVYGTKGTLYSKKNIFNGDETLNTIERGTPFTVGSMEILPFTVSHDAVDPVQFRISAGKKKISVATDLGYVSNLVTECIRNSDIVIVEANHDVEMLKNGPYSWELKQRIMSRTGHLSNRNAAETLFNVSSKRTGLRAVLVHLSEENNRADLAEKEVRDLFKSFDRPIRQLVIATQNEATEIIEV